ncbi:MAG: hypothetical protein KDI63_01475 [Gammaproteobacteria bacterium]|nr:hypothetical protein [Gammaproteobacteria bacterium]
MTKMCYSCCVPLDNLEFQGPAEHYCKYCTDEQGLLKSKEVVQEGVANWLQSWQPNLDRAAAQLRAAHFLRAMPAWAEDDS